MKGMRSYWRAMAALLGIGLIGLGAPASAGAAMIPVNITGDELNNDADCSLREAVQSARVDGSDTTGCVNGEGAPTDDTIVLGPGTYTLDEGDPLNPTDENLNATGDLDFAGNVVLRGAGRDATTITQVNNDRIIDASPASIRTLTLERLTIDGGNTTFGLTGDDQRGGNVRLRSGGNLVVREARISNGFGSVGGGIYAVDNSGSTTNSGSITIEDSLLELNQAEAFGGAMEVVGGMVVRIERSSLNTNKAAGSGAQLLGGALSNRTNAVGDEDGSMTIIDSVLSGNEVLNLNGPSGHSVGGAIRSQGELTVRSSLITGNRVNAVVDDDARQNGGGIWIAGGTARIVNTTIHGNDAGSDPSDEGFGGGVYVDAGRAFLDHVTLSGNEAELSGDSLATSNGAGDGIIISRSIIAGTGLTSDPCDSGTLPIASGGFNVAGYDDNGCGYIDSDTTGGVLGLTGSDPTDNGGPTPTIALGPDGAAVDKVPAAACGPAGGVDQRGFPRPLPLGGACDAGAYELHTCDGTTVLNGAYAACPVPPSPLPTPEVRCGGRIATVVGTEGADRLRGTSGDDVIAALGGKDEVRSAGGKDRICGGDGRDKLIGGGGEDRLFGDAGKDRLRGGGGKDRCAGGGGKDKAAGCERNKSI